jgi:hypothetical protein
MTGPPTNRVFHSAPPIKRAKPDGIPVRLHDGTLIAHVNREFDVRGGQRGCHFGGPHRAGPLTDDGGQWRLP